MGAVKNHYHDAICRQAAIEDGEALCLGCLEDLSASEEGLCMACWNEINGQFGVGA
jgi:predicted amidophosphoribosyltransferase